MGTLTDVASLATATGTLVLAVATFASVRSGTRTARAAERSLLAGIRPVLAPSRFGDPDLKINWLEEHWTRVPGGHGGVELTDEVIYLALPVRNVGSGIAVLHGWDPIPGWVSEQEHVALADFVRQQRDIYVPAGDLGMWQGALRDPTVPRFAAMREVIRRRERFTLDLLYGDHDGGQRTITRFGFSPAGEDAWLATVARHWNIDNPDPR
jgi:hypothetical protein